MSLANANHSPTKNPIFCPKLFSTLRDYSLQLFLNDLSAGFIVGIVAFPLAIAFAIASGVTPDRGLITAILAGFLISALGGSRVQIGGPTGAFVVIVYGIVHRFGLEGLILCTIMAGIILILMGVLRLGAIIRFIPYPLTVGFTAGIAVVIFSSQLKDFLGLMTGPLPADFIGKWQLYFKHIHTFDMTTVLVSLGSLALLILWPRINRRIPGSIIAILVVTAVIHFFKIPVKTIGSEYGNLPMGFSAPSLPSLNFLQLKSLMIPAFTVAMLGAIESLLSATVADGMIEGRHRSNTELIAQGVANVITPFFGGIPATGAIARTATNVRNGGRTPVAGVLHALTLFLIVIFLGRWVSLIPMGLLAAILILVSYHMSEWHSFKALLKAPKEDVIVLLISFFLTVFIDLTVAVEFGLLISLVLFVKRMKDVTKIKQVTEVFSREISEEELQNSPDAIGRRKVPDEVLVYEAEGAFFFGVAELLRDTLDVAQMPKVLILRMRNVLAVDATGLRALRDLHNQCVTHKIGFIISGIHTQPYHAMANSGFLAQIGKEYVFRRIDDALNKANEIILTTT